MCCPLIVSSVNELIESHQITELAVTFLFKSFPFLNKIFLSNKQNSYTTNLLLEVTINWASLSWWFRNKWFLSTSDFWSWLLIKSSCHFLLCHRIAESCAVRMRRKVVTFSAKVFFKHLQRTFQFQHEAKKRSHGQTDR